MRYVMCAVMEFRCRADSPHTIQLNSRIVAVRWRDDDAVAQQAFTLLVQTVFAGHKSKLKVQIFDADDRCVWHRRIEIQHALQDIDIRLKKPACESVYAKVELVANGQSLRSASLPLQSQAAVIFDQTWQRHNITRGELTRFSAQCRGIADGERVFIDLYQHLPGMVDKPLCGFAASVFNRRINQDWRFHYPLASDTLFFPYRRSQAKQSNSPLFYAVAHYRQLRFVQAHVDSLRMLRDESYLSLSPRSLAQCRALLCSSDGEQREVLLRQSDGVRFDMSPGPFLLKLYIDTGLIRAMSRLARDKRYDNLDLPQQLPLSKTPDYIDAPINRGAWQSVLTSKVPAMQRDLFGAARVLELDRAWPCRYAPELGLLAIAADLGTIKHAKKSRNVKNNATKQAIHNQQWHYYQLNENLLLPLNAIDASGKHYHGAAIAFVDNHGEVSPFYLSGTSQDYQYALYRQQQSDIIALWSSSGKPVAIDIALARIARAIQQLDNRDAATNS